MKHLGRQAVLTTTVIFTLAGCGGAVPTGAVPRGAMAQTIVHRASNSSGDFLYVSGPTETVILSYASGSIVNSFSTEYPLGTCSSDNGDVFIPQSQKILKYKHGGISPVATLQDAGFVPGGCASDTTTQNLAVANIETFNQEAGNVAVYSKATGKPAFYSNPSISNYEFCTYDGSGNLFVTGKSSSQPFILAELPKGSRTFTIINVNANLPRFGPVEWDGTDLVLGTNVNTTLYRVQVSGSSGTVVGTTKLSKTAFATFSFYIYGNKVLAPAGRYGRNLGFWRYPQGGRRVKGIGPLYDRHASIAGITVSKDSQSLRGK